MAEVDGNTGGSDSTSTGVAGTATGGTGQTADPGHNPVEAHIEGNDTSVINEGTGAKGFVSDEAVEAAKVVEVEAAKKAGIKIEGEGTYDRATGIITEGEITITDENGVKVTKRAG